MILILNDGLIRVEQNSLENINNAKIYLNFQDLHLQHNHIVKLMFNKVEMYKTGINTFKINPKIFTGNIMEIEVVVFQDSKVLKEYSGNTQLEEYFSFGSQGYEKIPQILIDLNKEIKKLEDRILELEKEKNVI